ncbi:hypothetical protein RZS08_35035, partial [Arthrospira platensis SPKY1]|nr:hypothetical protein [Arthrospira platensis SPKY1]
MRALADSLEMVRALAETQPPIQPENLEVLLNYYAGQELRRLRSMGLESDPVMVFGIADKERVVNILRELYEEAVIDRSKTDLQNALLTLRQPFNNSQTTMEPSRVYDLNEALA